MAPHQKDPSFLTEHVRPHPPGRSPSKLVGAGGELQLITLDRQIEETISPAGSSRRTRASSLSLDPEFVAGHFWPSLNQQALELASQSGQAVVLCSPLIRSHLKS